MYGTLYISTEERRSFNKIFCTIPAIVYVIAIAWFLSGALSAVAAFVIIEIVSGIWINLLIVKDVPSKSCVACKHQFSGVWWPGSLDFLVLVFSVTETISIGIVTGLGPQYRIMAFGLHLVAPFYILIHPFFVFRGQDCPNIPKDCTIKDDPHNITNMNWFQFTLEYIF